MARERQADTATSAAASTAAATSAVTAGAGHSELAAEPAVGSAATSAPALSREALDLEFELAGAVIYHRSREAWFRGLHRAVLFLTTMLGAGSIASLVPPAVTGLAIAFLGALDLTLELSASASTHAELRARYMGVVRKLVQGDWSAARCRRGRDAMLKIATESPPSYVAVEDVAHNQAIISLGRDRAHLAPVTGLRYWTRHVVRWEGRGA